MNQGPLDCKEKYISIVGILWVSAYESYMVHSLCMYWRCWTEYNILSDIVVQTRVYIRW